MERKINIPTLLAVATMFFAVATWSARQDSRLHNVEQAVASYQGYEAERRGDAIKLARFEERVVSFEKLLVEIRDELRRMREKK